MATNFPTGLDTYVTLVDNTDFVLASHANDRGDAIEALEVKVGITSSAVAATLDYFLKHASGAYRTHTHDGSSDDGAKLDWDTCWTDAVHAHSSNAEGGTLDWDNCWVDAVHDHSANAEGGATLGLLTFSSIPVLPASNPTTDNQAARKAYVDVMGQAAGGNLTGTYPNPSVSNMFGAWVDKSSSYGAQQAATDGEINAYHSGTAGGAISGLDGYTDANANPALKIDSSKVWINGQVSVANIHFSVKKNDYWKVVITGESGTIKVYWIPLGN